jgi:hypothetical protein
MTENAKDNEGMPNPPSHYAYHVNEGQDGKSYFNRVGAAFPHKDGQGFNVVLDSVPVDGLVTLRTPQERIQAMKDGPNAAPERQDREQSQ